MAAVAQRVRLGLQNAFDNLHDGEVQAFAEGMNITDWKYQDREELINAIYKAIDHLVAEEIFNSRLHALNETNSVQQEDDTRTAEIDDDDATTLSSDLEWYTHEELEGFTKPEIVTLAKTYGCQHTGPKTAVIRRILAVPLSSYQTSNRDNMASKHPDASDTKLLELLQDEFESMSKAEQLMWAPSMVQ